MTLDTGRRTSADATAPPRHQPPDGTPWALPHEGIVTDAGPLLDSLALHQLGSDEFEGWCQAGVRARGFGGQVAAQALLAAAGTAPQDRPVHSLHTSFVAASDPDTPVRYTVQRLRDGGSFSSRAVTASQHGKVVLHGICSLQRPETGPSHQPPAPSVPEPAALSSVCRRPLELRPIVWAPPDDEATRAYEQLLWLRCPDPLPDRPALHAAALVFATDVTLGWAGWKAHGVHAVTPDMFATSLDHTLWFHRVPRAGEWLLLRQQPIATAGARGLAGGQLFTAAGELVATVAQEGLMRTGLGS